MAFKTEKPWEPEPFTAVDRDFVCMVFGWICGFSWFVVWTAVKQTRKFSTYTVLIWAEIIACAIFAFICLFYLLDIIPHSFAFFMSILTCWALQVQFLLQIIVNRICLLWGEKRHQNYLKYGVAALITAVNISVYCIWIPSRLQINSTYVHVNEIWDRTEKCIYLIVDAWLNWLFMRTVNRRLLSHGLDRYRPLVRFNVKVIWISLSMDCLIIGMMSYPNSFVCSIPWLTVRFFACFRLACYEQLTMVSLRACFAAFNHRSLMIEMSMSDLMVQIVTAKRKVGPITFDHGDALQIAVTTHTETTAIQLDPMDPNEKLRTTRTPARPDLAERLARMRREKKEREERAANQWNDEKDDDLDIKEEFDDWKTASRTTVAVPELARNAGDGRVRFDGVRVHET